MIERVSMKRYGILAFLAFLVLGVVSVWYGALNQDEGWYLYAANLVSEGQVPYRDFFFTQGPVMPYVYSLFTGFWRNFGLVGARIFNLSLGFLGIAFACALARRFSTRAAVITFVLLATNLYHLYYLTIPKTYALASLFVILGFYALSFERRWTYALSALFFVLAAGTRFSLVAIPLVVALALFWPGKRGWVVFALSGLLFGGLLFIPFLSHETAKGFYAALSYHTARGGFDPVWTVGSLSRLVRWYLPIFLVLVLGIRNLPSGLPRTMFTAFVAVFLLQISAPFPYEDYQVPIMGLLAVVSAVAVCAESASESANKPAVPVFLVFALSCAVSFGSPLLEKWKTNGQDRFWTLKKECSELAQLRDVSRRIEALDPNGNTILTQDLYLAIEMNRRVPAGLEMGPFADLSDGEWQNLLLHAAETCPVAALSGYTFAIEPPSCNERSVATQLKYWALLGETYEPAFREESFGQNSTPLLVLKRK